MLAGKLVEGNVAGTSGAAARALYDAGATLLSHENRRVRAALAKALRDTQAPPTAMSQLVMARLVDDGDYKVRASAALAITRISSTTMHLHLSALLLDQNWHVRERVLQGLLTDLANSEYSDDLVSAALSLVSSESSWKRCPAHVRPMLDRLHLLRGEPKHDGAVPERALFGVLREIRTGWTRLSEREQTSFIIRGLQSADWLVRREAVSLVEAVPHGSGKPIHIRRETFRRLRDRRSVQIALDMRDVDEAVAVGQAAATAGIDFLEVGDPLIKQAGLRAVEHIKKNLPGVMVVAEMMSADWGRDQVVLAAEAGADVVMLIGPATTASVSAAVQAGRRLGVPILLDVPARLASQHWIEEMERAGVDGFTVTANIDIGIAGGRPLDGARAIRAWTRLPVGVSGGFSATDHSIIGSHDWDILIVGRSVADAVEPADAARQITESVRDSSGGAR